MAHISRKDLKKDEVRETFAHGAEALRSHQQLTTAVLSVVIVIALAVLVWRIYSQRQDVKSSAAYDAAMQAYQARVITPGQPAAQPGEVTFTVEKIKYSESAKKFTELATQYPRTRSGKLAKYYAALSNEKIGNDAQAKQLLSELATDSDADLSAMAKFALAGLDDRTGQSDEAAKLYQQLIDKPSVLVPKPVVMLALAQHYAEKDPAQAAKLFSQIKTDYPDTPIADSADQGLSLLPGKS